MEFGQIIYVVAVVAYFLYRATSKKKTDSLPEGENPTPGTPEKGLTFEELLREIREAQSPTVPDVKEAPIPLPNPQEVYPTSRKEKAEQYAESVQESLMNEGVDAEAETLTQNAIKQFNERSNSSRVPRTIEPTKLYELSQEIKNPYAELLKNPKTFREAVVVSEILQPKHF